MISEIYLCEKIFPIIRCQVEEAGISVSFGNTLLLNNDLDDSKVVILKPDAFYDTKNFAMPPRSTDACVIVVNDNKYKIYIIELKSSKLNRIDKNEIQDKFETIFSRFFQIDFPHIFMREYEVEEILSWVVCDPLGLRGIENEEIFMKSVKKFEKRIKNMLMEYSLGFKPYRFKNKI